MQFIEGKQYIKLNTPIERAPQILEFFSFYCPHCYQLEQILNISNSVQQLLPIGTKIIKYHVDFLGPLGCQLTHAWAVAIAMGIENKISPVLFNYIQTNNIIHTINGVRNLFIKQNINLKQYNAMWNSFVVKTILFKQKKIVNDLQLQIVPTILINGKYIIKTDSLDYTSIKSYIKQFTAEIKFLLMQ